ncbi:MAG: hypothetical protein LC781_20265 [Actinobacteria bacterium]|nr:hypothetical protein [Actinomycetota bacterium]
MRKGRAEAIIVVEMVESSTVDEAAVGDGGAGATRRPVPVALAVSGDPVVGRALALLLSGSRYDARFVPTPSSGEPESLEGIRLLLITPTQALGDERREALVASLVSRAATAGVPILELATSAGGARDAKPGPRRLVPWPCSTEELERHIEGSLLAAEGAGAAARRSPLARGEEEGGA